MSDYGLSALTQLSDAITAATSRAAPLLTAVRVSPGRHVSGFLWHGGVIVTSDQALPAQDSYSVVLSNGAVAPARPGPRDPSANLAMLLLDTGMNGPTLPRGNRVAVGSLVLALGAGFDGSAAVRLAVVHRLERNSFTDLPAAILDIAATQVDPGGPVLNAAGELLGMVRLGPQGEASVLPSAAIARFCDAAVAVPAPPPSTSPSPSPQPVVPPRAAVRVPLGPRRGWLGVALQPITVPEALAQRAGQNSARMVMTVTAGGPADRGGVRVGDVLLAVNGHNTSGSHALRAFLGADRIGTRVEVRLLRDGVVQTAHLTIAAQPAE